MTIITRKATNELLEKAEAGVLTWEQIARSALEYMSEDDVSDMANREGFIEDDTNE